MRTASLFGFVLLSLALVQTSLAEDKKDDVSVSESSNSNVYFSNLEIADQLKNPSNFGQLIQQHLVRRQRNRRQMKKRQSKKQAAKNLKPKQQKVQKEQKKRRNAKSRAAVTHKKQASKKAHKSAPKSVSKTASKAKPKAASKQKSAHKKRPQKVHNQGKLRLRLKAKKTKRAGSNCADEADNCSEFITFCPVAEYKAILNQYCHMSCGYCARDSEDCSDAAQFQSSCRSWANKGFCTSTFFDKNTIRAMCSKSCKLCAKAAKTTAAPSGASTTVAVVQPGATTPSTTPGSTISGTTGTAGSTTPWTTGTTDSTTSGSTTTSSSTTSTTSTTTTTQAPGP